jgi:hypothetical protein
MLNFEVNKMDEFYTRKHYALAEKLCVSPSIIQNENDEVFYLCDKENNHEQEFWVLTSDDALDTLKSFIGMEFNMPMSEFDLSHVAKSLGVEEQGIKEFFLPEILTGEIDFSYGTIDITPLRKYVEEMHSIEIFIDNFCEFIIDIGKSGSFLCSRMQETKNDIFHIYYR